MSCRVVSCGRRVVVVCCKRPGGRRASTVLVPIVCERWLNLNENFMVQNVILVP